MKKRLNIIRYVFLGILICAAAFNVYLKSDMIFNDVETTTRSQENRDDLGSYCINLTPNRFIIMDSLFNEKTGQWMSAYIKEVSVYIPEEENAKPSIADTIVNYVKAILMLGSAGMIFFNFIYMIDSVEKSIVFAWKNVRRLRLIGLGLFIFFIVDAFSFIYSGFIEKDLIKISDYSVVMESISTVGILTGGVVAFFVAEIFAVGLRLKEEQDLTI